jgi:hypothetical protein
MWLDCGVNVGWLRDKPLSLGLPIAKRTKVQMKHTADSDEGTLSKPSLRLFGFTSEQVSLRREPVSQRNVMSSHAGSVERPNAAFPPSTSTFYVGECTGHSLQRTRLSQTGKRSTMILNSYVQLF